MEVYCKKVTGEMASMMETLEDKSLNFDVCVIDYAKIMMGQVT